VKQSRRQAAKNDGAASASDPRTNVDEQAQQNASEVTDVMQINDAPRLRFGLPLFDDERVDGSKRVGLDGGLHVQRNEPAVAFADELDVRIIRRDL